MLSLFQVKCIRMQFEVKPYDIDAAGHVNNIVYIRWIEDLRTRFSEANFNLPKIIHDGLYLAVVATSINYKCQVKLFDELTGILEFVSFNHGIITFKIIISSGNCICAVAEQKCAFINLADNKMKKDMVSYGCSNIS